MSTLADVLEARTAEAAPELIESISNQRIRCYACGHECPIPEGATGVCKVRFNRDGRLHVPWGYVGGVQCDPIEKKPFFHAHPGALAYSFGMLGCDLHCSYCQNWVTSQALRDPNAVSPPVDATPAALVADAKRLDARVVVSTYNEPLITAEWAVAIFKEARAAGLMTGFVSNGNGTGRVLKYIRPWIDLYKVDLKSFNDAPEELERLTAFIASVSPDIPWHVTAFHKDYRMSDPENTTPEMLIRAADIARRAGLRYVYAGNIPGRVGDLENTRCHQCSALLIERYGYLVRTYRITPHGTCPDCGTAIPGRWGRQFGGQITASPFLPGTRRLRTF